MFLLEPLESTVWVYAIRENNYVSFRAKVIVIVWNNIISCCQAHVLCSKPWLTCDTLSAVLCCDIILCAATLLLGIISCWRFIINILRHHRVDLLTFFVKARLFSVEDRFSLLRPHTTVPDHCLHIKQRLDIL